MTTTMHTTRTKFNKFKVAGASLAAGAVLVTSGYVLGNGQVFNTKPATADTTSMTKVDTDPNTDSAMVKSAVDSYLAQITDS